MGVNGGVGEVIQRPGERLLVRMIIGPASEIILILSRVGDWRNNCPTIFCLVSRQESKDFSKSRDMHWQASNVCLGGRLWLTKPQLIWVPVRNASLNSAIGRGLRRSQNVNTSPRRSNGRRSLRRDEFLTPSRASKGQERVPTKQPDIIDFDEDEFIRTGRFLSPRERQSRDQTKSKDNTQQPKPSSGKKEKPPSTKSRARKATDSMPERVKENVKVPDSIPYTTPASEFIYGTGAVEAALRCSRRQLYRLYLYQGVNEELSPAKVALRKLALSKNIAIKMAFAGWDRLLDKMSAGRPHNGCVLEASPLPKLPVRGFLPVPAVTESQFRVELAPQTREEAAVNGTDDRIPILHPRNLVQQQQRDARRFPVALLLDGVVDTGNLGAIIRSAYFLGIDAIVFAGRNSAPLSPVTIKASAGAAENMPLLQVRNEVDFIQRSKNNGWRFYAADAPAPGATYLDRLSEDGGNGNGHGITQSPSVLMMGSEASGLSSHIKSAADAIVSIPGARHSLDLGVESDPARIDSLNVSVAAALLMEMFLHTPLGLSTPVKGKNRMW